MTRFTFIRFITPHPFPKFLPLCPKTPTKLLTLFRKFSYMAATTTRTRQTPCRCFSRTIGMRTVRTTTMLFTDGILTPPMLNGLTSVLCRALATRPSPRHPTNPLLNYVETMSDKTSVSRVWNETQFYTREFATFYRLRNSKRQHNTPSSSPPHQTTTSSADIEDPVKYPSAAEATSYVSDSSAAPTLSLGNEDHTVSSG